MFQKVYPGNKLNSFQNFVLLEYPGTFYFAHRAYDRGPIRQNDQSGNRHPNMLLNSSHKSRFE